MYDCSLGSSELIKLLRIIIQSNFCADLGLGRRGNSDITKKLTWAHITTRCHITVERSSCTDQVPPKPGKRKKFVSLNIPLPYAGKPARKCDERSYFLDVNR